MGNLCPCWTDDEDYDPVRVDSSDYEGDDRYQTDARRKKSVGCSKSAKMTKKGTKKPPPGHSKKKKNGDEDEGGEAPF